MRFNRIRVPVAGYNAIEDRLDEIDDYLDDYFFDYATPAPPRITYSVHGTVQVGHFPSHRSHAPRPRFHGLGLHPPFPPRTRCPYGCSYTQPLHRALTRSTDIERWARTYPGVVLNLQGQRQFLPEGGLETEEAAARRIQGQIADDFQNMGVMVDRGRGIEQSYRYDRPPGLWHLTVSNYYGRSEPHIHFHFEGPARPLF